MAVNYGQVAIVPKGVWNAETQYKVNNLVEYDGSSYVAKVQPPVGIRNSVSSPVLPSFHRIAGRIT